LTNRLLAAQSPEQRYADTLAALLKEVDNLEEASVKRVLQLLADARRRIIDAISEVDESSYLAQFLPRLQRSVEETMAEFSRTYHRYFDEQSRHMWDFGLTSVDQPLVAVGLDIMAAIPSIEPRLVSILQGYQAELITNMSADAIRKISTELQLGTLGGRTPFQIQREVAEVLRTQADAAGRFGSIATRAEVITRTELNRSFSLATQSRQEQLQQRASQVFPELTPRKQWLNAGDARVRPAHRRPALLAQRPVLTGDFTLQDTDGATYQAKGPHDPRLPAALAISCRCRSVVDVESLRPALDGE